MIRRDALVVVDVEATCWEGKTPPGQQGEIIEIGVCLLDLESLEASAPRGILVRPERSKVSAFCTRLTSLTQDMVNGGLWFAEACELLTAEYGTQTRLWSSWGNYDRLIFEHQCRDRHIGYPFVAEHFNAKTRFAELQGIRAAGMARALQMAGLPLEGTHHRGADDAGNIARLVAWMIRSYGFDILPWKE